MAKMLFHGFTCRFCGYTGYVHRYEPTSWAGELSSTGGPNSIEGHAYRAVIAIARDDSHAGK